MTWLTFFCSFNCSFWEKTDIRPSVVSEARMEEHKKHRTKKAGPKAERKKEKNSKDNQTARQRNPKAFSIQSAVKAVKKFHRSQDVKTKKIHIPLPDRTVLEPPPIIVVIVGPPKVGKTTLLQCLVKNYTRQKITNIQGPVTVVSGKQRRLTFMECSNDINHMIDIAKVADLVCTNSIIPVILRMVFCVWKSDLPSFICFKEQNGCRAAYNPGVSVFVLENSGIGQSGPGILFPLSWVGGIWMANTCWNRWTHSRQ